VVWRVRVRVRIRVRVWIRARVRVRVRVRVGANGEPSGARRALETPMMPLPAPMRKRVASAKPNEGDSPNASWNTMHDQRPTSMTGRRPTASERRPSG